MIKITGDVVSNEYVLHEDYAELIIYGGKHGTKRVIINIDDIERCRSIKWYVNMYGYKRDKVYITSSSKQSSWLLHRYIMDAPKDMCVDHIDGNTLDNRKENLRICTRQQNNMNKSHKNNAMSGHKGITWYPHRGINKWRVHIKINTKFKTIGYYEDIDDAIEARRKAEEKYFGEYARK